MPNDEVTRDKSRYENEIHHEVYELFVVELEILQVQLP